MKKAPSHSHRPASQPELAAPRVGSYTAPTGFFIVLAILAYLGHAELGYNHGLFSSKVYEPYADLRSIPKAGGDVNPVDAGREVYAQLCSACHQPNGSGNPANGCPPVAGSDWVLEEGPARLIRIVLNGAKGPIQVNGKEWGNAVGMLAFKDSLSDEQIAHVLTYIRQSPEWKNNAPAVPVELVKSIREKTSSRGTQWTIDELLKVPTVE
ncbi:MAG: cytochrome c [Verrucomicrobiales bacterium]|nr:cytochrome c [Verrucomicrobiales bacterium]